MRTKSEQVFEGFLSDNNLAFEEIKTAATSRPDYLVRIGESKLVFEIKELAEDKNVVAMKDPSGHIIKTYYRKVGEHVRTRIHRSRKQIQFAARQDLPAILLIYNNLDPLHLFGTEDLDFLTAMYGELTLNIDKRSGQATTELFYGRNQLVAEAKNTSFSAVGRLAPHSGEMIITLFENTFAKIKIAYEQLPSCFHVERVNISTNQAPDSKEIKRATLSAPDGL